MRIDLKPAGSWTGTANELPPAPFDTAYPRVPVLVTAGQVTFHHGATMHASDVNTSARERVSLVSHLMASDCCFRPGQGHVCITRMQAQPGAPQPGERFRGPQFPWALRDDAR